MALLGWAPIGFAVAAVIGEQTGCGRFAASCSELSSPGTWIVEVAVLFLLLALPRLARIVAHGALATIMVGIPVAIVLSASGGAHQPAASAAVLTVSVAIAWLVGIGYAVVVPRLRGSGRTAPS